MWDFSGIEGLVGPIVGFLAAVLVISIVISIGWFIADSFKNKS